MVTISHVGTANTQDSSSSATDAAARSAQPRRLIVAQRLFPFTCSPGLVFRAMFAFNPLLRADSKAASFRPSPHASPVPRQYDDLPDFGSLTNDEDRERKAETRRPGTFAVIVNPDSFSQHPDYASTASPADRRMSEQSGRGSLGSPVPSLRRSSIQIDPNTVVLDRFEDASVAAQSHSAATVSPQPSFPDDMQRLSISTNPPAAPLYTTPLSRVTSPDNLLLDHFRRYVARMLIQPQIDGSPHDLMGSGSTQEVFEAEAARFRPLHHAICAISALNLAYNGRSSLEEAMQHYHSALSSTATPTTQDDLISDGVLLRHFLLFVYDICVPISTDNGESADMWADHLNHLLRIATQRHARLGQEPHGYIMWIICELDMYACLMGSGSCHFIQTVLQQDMLPPLDAQIPRSGLSGRDLYQTGEAPIFPAILALNQGVIIHTAKLAQSAQKFRDEASNIGRGQAVSPGVYARWQDAVSRLQSELFSFWTHTYPEFLGGESPQAGFNLPIRVRYVFEQAFALFHAAIIYSRTSMFPGQSLIPIANQSTVTNDTERRCVGILALVTELLSNQHQSDLQARRRFVFPLFMAGFATNSPDAKLQAMKLIRAMEVSAGIGQNTYRTRQLLGAVCEAQREALDNDERMETVEWLAVAREKGLSVINCGL